MNVKITSAMIGILLIHAVPASHKAWAERPTFAVTGGYSGATTELDAERTGSTEVRFRGVAVAARVGLRPRWGIQVNQSWVDSNDRLETGDELSFRALHVHAYRSWRAEFKFRPYVKFGLMALEFEADPGAGSTVESDDVAPSIGGGFEWGTQRAGVFFDGGFAPLDVELSGDVEESVFVGNTTVGLFYRFGQTQYKRRP